MVTWLDFNYSLAVVTSENCCRPFEVDSSEQSNRKQGFWRDASSTLLRHFRSVQVEIVSVTCKSIIYCVYTANDALSSVCSHAEKGKTTMPYPRLFLKSTPSEVNFCVAIIVLTAALNLRLALNFLNSFKLRPKSCETR